MSLCDPVADMLTRIRNGSRSQKSEVLVKCSRVCEGIAAVLKDEGYIKDYDKVETGNQPLLRVRLKYSMEGNPAITEITRKSKPGCRVYTSVADMPIAAGGMGIVIVSTSKGVMSDRNCRAEKVGGELLCMVS